MESQGRMATEAEVINQCKQIRFEFGGRGAAISDFF
jgi:hypothetical protein